MEARLKAKELFDKYVDYVRMYNDDTPRLDMQKQCALIAVDEILSNDGFSSSIIEWDIFISYWQEVKQEIKNL